MKLPFTFAICCATFTLLGTPSVRAQSYGQGSARAAASGSEKNSATEQAGQRSNTKEFFHANQIIGTEAKDAQGQSLGKVHDVVFSAQKGEVFAAVDIGHDRYALVPWQEVKVTANGSTSGWSWWGHNKEQVTINTTKQALQSAPSISGQQTQRLNDPAFVQSVFSYFHTQSPNASMGGAGESSLGNTSGGSNHTSTQQGSQPK